MNTKLATQEHSDSDFLSKLTQKARRHKPPVQTKQISQTFFRTQVWAPEKSQAKITQLLDTLQVKATFEANAV